MMTTINARHFRQGHSACLPDIVVISTCDAGERKRAKVAGSFASIISPVSRRVFGGQYHRIGNNAESGAKSGGQQ